MNGLARGMDALLDVLRFSFVQLCVLFALLVLAYEVGLLPRSLGLLALAFGLPILAIPVLVSRRQGAKASPLPAPLLLLLAFVLALVLRLGASLGNEVLLGYDPGLYKYLMDLYLQGLPQIPEATLPSWVRFNYPQGLPVMSTVAHLVLGLTPEELMRYAFPLLAAATVFPVYLLGRAVFGQRAAILSAFLYAVSYTQFSMFTLMYLKNGVALFLLPLALYTLHRRNYALFSLFLAGIAIYHRPTLLVVAAVALAYLLATRRRRGILVSVLAASALVAPFYLPRLDLNWALLQGALDAGLGSLGEPMATAGGTFFSLERYRWVSLTYGPFAMVGAAYLFYRRRWAGPLLLLLSTAALVVLQVAFFRRHLVPLDLAMLLLAGLGIEVAVLRRGRGGLLGMAAVLAIVLAAAMPTLEGYREVKPLVTSEQLRAAEWLAAHTPPDAAVVVANHDAPWALGWSGRRVIAPGLFQWNRHDREQWQRFLGTEDVELARRFLSEYDGPLYVLYTESEVSYMAEEKFQPPLFHKLYDRGGARIYVYSPPEQYYGAEVRPSWTSLPLRGWSLGRR